MITAASSTPPVTMYLTEDCERQQVHAVGDRADHRAPSSADQTRAAAAEEAGAGDHRAGDRDQQQVAAARGLVDGEQPRRGQDAADRRHRAEHSVKTIDADPVDADAGPPRRLGVAADGEHVAAEQASAWSTNSKPITKPKQDHQRQRQAAVGVEDERSRRSPPRRPTTTRATSRPIGSVGEARREPVCGSPAGRSGPNRPTTDGHATIQPTAARVEGVGEAR